MAKVLVFRGRRKEGAYDLGRREMVIGRGEGADIRVDNPIVSRSHAVLKFQGGDWRVEDLASPNGLYVNGKRVKDHALQPGDRIELGQHVVVFVASGDEAWDVDTVADLRRSEALLDEPTAILPAEAIQSIHRKVQRRLRAHLVVEGDTGRTEIPLTGDRVVLGFSDDCDVRLPGRAVFGKRAAELVFRDGGWAVVALTSLIPVRFREQKVSSRRLTDGDVFEIKDVQVTYHGSIGDDP